MSSPSIPVVSPADLDKVVVYNSGGEEFEHRRRASVRDWSLVCGGGGGFSGGPEADQVLSRAAKGGEHGAVCGEGRAFAGWLEKGGILGGDLWEALSLPALRGGTQQEATRCSQPLPISRLTPRDPAHTSLPTLDNSDAPPANPDGNSLSIAINTPLKPSPTVPGHVIRPRPPTLVYPTRPGVSRRPRSGRAPN
ncbi:hypothetical protein C0989_005407 [Termitomyces sp. Mn162]|nr:hypothetical protein C0989_005407 [Termitomyces sp. Mn162]